MPTTRVRAKPRSNVTRLTTRRGRAPRASYDQLKEFQGQRYSGMKVGRGHKWRYDAGEWRETKVTPDKWEFEYSVVKRRAGRAPEGSGAPVGTAYRWYILAHQVVTKQDANSYTTEMVGLKHKLAHKRAGKDSWNASERAQRKRLIKVLHELIAELEKPVPERAAGETAEEASTSRRKRKAKPTGRARGQRARGGRKQIAA
jgi:hypothetical protein